MRKARKVYYMAVVQSKEQKRVYSGSTKRGQNLLCYADGHLSSQESGVGTEVSEMQRPGLHSEVAQWKTIHAPFLCSQSKFASQMTAAKVMDVIARLLGCAGQPAYVVSAYTQVPWMTRRNCEETHSQSFQIIRLPRLKWPNSWSNIEDPVVPLERNLYGHPFAGLWWEKAVRRSSVGSFLAGKKFRSENVCSFTKTKIVLIGKRGWHQNGRKKAWHGSHVEEIDETCRTWRTKILSWPHIWMHSMWMQAERKYHWRVQKNVRIRKFFRSNWQLPGWEETSKQKLSRGRTIWGVMRKSALKDIVNWHKKREATVQSLKSLLGWPSFQEGGTGNGVRVGCPKYVLKLSWTTGSWTELEGLTFFGWYTNLLEQSQNGQELVTGAWLWFHTQWLPTMLSCGKHGSALSIGSIPRLRFRWRPWKF